MVVPAAWRRGGALRRVPAHQPPAQQRRPVQEPPPCGRACRGERAAGRGERGGRAGGRVAQHERNNHRVLGQEENAVVWWHRRERRGHSTRRDVGASGVISQRPACLGFHGERRAGKNLSAHRFAGKRTETLSTGVLKTRTEKNKEKKSWGRAVTKNLNAPYALMVGDRERTGEFCF